MPSLLRSASLTNFVTVAREVGLSPDMQLRRAGISAAALLDPDIRLPAQPAMRMLEESAEISGAQDFGLRMGETRQFANLGPLTIALQEAPTLRRALESFSRYVRLQNEAMATRLQEEGDVALLIVEVLGLGPGTFRQSVELVVCVLHRTLTTLLGSDWKPRGICFSHRPPASLATHRRIFRMPVDFKQDFNGIVLSRADLDTPISSYDPLLASHARVFLDAKLAQSNAGMAEKVTQLIFALLPVGECDSNQVAQKLGMHRKTLYRHLAEHGHTWSSLVDEVRAELVTRYVESDERPFTDVARLLGFSSLSAFSRWFTARYGCAPSSWRRSRKR
ncbi:AraC family transcriptional regulator [Paraburkholderia sp. A3BS-1L]|uniref:AraC family transcriptional regulator n=1 Tax=Paraburkholderia sp. A3BS-1L TaxID=3028375 RepID=UPI003DA99235